MGVDLQKLKERAAEEEAKALARAAGGARFWTPKAGENKVRLLPPWTSDPKNPNRDQFYREIYVHFSVGLDDDSAKVFSCQAKTPHVVKTSCPVCQFVEKLRGSGVPSDAEIAENMRAKQRFYTNVVVLDDPAYTQQDLAEWKARQDDKARECPWSVGDTKVQVMTYGPQIWGDLMAIFMDSQVDVTDVAKGHNVTIKREGVKLQTKYRASADWQPSPFTMIGKPLAEATINLDALMPFQPEGVMLEALSGIGTVALPAPTGAQPPRPAPPGLPAAGGAANGATQPAQPQLPATQPVPQQPASQPAQPAQPKSLPQAAAAPALNPDDLPPCYLDKTTVSPEDAECVGGKKGVDEYDKCPAYSACHTLKFGPAPEPEKEKPKGRRSAAKRAPAADTSQPGSVDALEAEMKQSLGK